MWSSFYFSCFGCAAVVGAQDAFQAVAAAVVSGAAGGSKIG